MRVPIQYALSYPERFASNQKGFDWEKLSLLEFMEPDMERFPCLRLAYDALEQGASFPCALNAADEVAVEAFLDRRISFASIPKLVEDVLLSVPARRFESMDEVLEHDRLCRERARQWLKRSA
jgi:1-deoxy-D-xylulose-5-phosphate reductoisomerase